MKYKVGDKVRIRKNLEADKTYGKKKLISEMEKYLGYETTIKACREKLGYYVLDIDAADGHWGWSEEMLEPVTECDFKVGDKVILNPKRVKKPGVFTIEEIIPGDGNIFYKLSCDKAGGWLQEDIIKVPMFKVGQIVQFKNIKEDKWYPGTDDMANLEGKLGMVAEITINFYTVDKPNQDGCQYSVRDLTAGRWWSVTSAAIELVPTTSELEDVTSVTQDKGLTTDIGITTTTAEVIAQAVDNVKGPQFKIGDKVLIREDLVPGKEYNEWDYSPEDGLGGWVFLPEMVEYKGKVATITGFGDMGDVNYLRLDIDGGQYSWIINAVSHYTPGSDYDSDKQIINKQTKQNYENQLQGKEEPLIGGCECTGTGVCYPGEQAATCIGHLGYRKIAYRS